MEPFQAFILAIPASGNLEWNANIRLTPLPDPAVAALFGPFHTLLRALLVVAVFMRIGFMLSLSPARVRNYRCDLAEASNHTGVGPGEAHATSNDPN